MKTVDFIAQPAHRTTLDAIESIAKTADLASLDTVAAYITSSGVHDLLQKVDAVLGEN